MVKKIFNIVLSLVVLVLVVTWVTDFIMVGSEKDPIFCLSSKTHTYSDGTVKECTGLGYKVYKYDRKSVNVKTEFGPMFITKMRGE